MTDELTNEVDTRIDFLDDFVQGKIIKPDIPENVTQDFRFIVARKWSSWYPSYFKTIGGCYAFVSRDNHHRPPANAGVIIIDPGFGFLDTIRREYQIEPHDIKSVIVTHFHPDHSAGLIDFLTLTYESHHSTKVYLNPTTYEFFKAFQGKYNRIFEVNREEVVKLADYNYKKVPTRKESVELKIKPVHHCEIGNRHQSMGLNFDIKLNGREPEHRLTILGDTDGSEKYFDEYISTLKGSEIIVLHMGTFSDRKYGQGDMHLYKSGTNNLLKRIIENDDIMEELNLIILSELGLELAPIKEIIDLMGEFNWGISLYNLLIFSKFLKKAEDDEYVDEWLKPEDENIKKYREKYDLAIHKRIFSPLVLNALRKSFEKLDNNTEIEKFFACIFFLTVSFNPIGFIDYAPLIDESRDNARNRYINGLQKKFNEYIEEMYRFSEKDIGEVVEVLRNYLNQAKNKLGDFRRLNRSAFGGSIFENTIRFVRSLQLIKEKENNKEIFNNIRGSTGELKLIYNFLDITLKLMSKSIDNVERKAEEGKIRGINKEPFILEEIHKTLEDNISQWMKNKGNKRAPPKLFIGFLGFEILFSEGTLKIKDEHTRDKYNGKEWIPLNKAVQGFDKGVPIIKMKED